jgi:ech hydrogenase subunit F
MFDFFPVIMKNAFHKPATRNYPKVSRPPFDRQRGHIEIDLPACIYCGMCSRKCPTGAIEVKRPDKLWSIDRFKCILCNSCVEVCPKKCLSMGSEPMQPASKKSIDVFKMPQAPAPVETEKAAEKEGNLGA